MKRLLPSRIVVSPSHLASTRTGFHSQACNRFPAIFPKFEQYVCLRLQQLWCAASGKSERLKNPCMYRISPSIGIGLILRLKSVKRTHLPVGIVNWLIMSSGLQRVKICNKFDILSAILR